jgi:cobalt-zinc-cadmium efflux system protein
MGDHGHAHAHAATATTGADHKKRLFGAFALTAGFFFVQAAAGVLTRSLALVSDAAHMLTDVVGLGMALAAIHLAQRGSKQPQRTFGLYRLEILAALANALLLFGVAGYVLVEALRRLQNPAEVLAGPMFAVAVAGLGVNLVAYWLLRRAAEESINVEAAYLEVLADAIGSVGVIVAAVVVAVTDWPYADPIVGAAIGLWILPRTWRLARQALRILMQAAPPDIHLDEMHEALASLEGVVDVHDLHVWTLTSQMEVATVHLVVKQSADLHSVLDAARDLLAARYDIEHATLQVEPEDHQGCAEITW